MRGSILALSVAACWGVLAAAPVVHVVTDFATERHIHKGPFHLGELERDRYFRSYHSPGLFSEARNRELREIGALPGRGSYRIDLPLPVDDAAIAHAMGAGKVKSPHHPEPYVIIYSRIPTETPVEHAIAHGSYPVWMRQGADLLQLQQTAVEDWQTIGHGNVLRQDLYPVVADGVVRMYDHWKQLGVQYPRYYTVQNEPIWQWQTEDLAGFHNVVARQMRAAHPDVAVGGPCYAWPYPRGDWQGWTNPARFIELSGGELGFYDMHFYSKGDWALPPEPRWQQQRVDHPSLYRSQRLGVGNVWDFGRLEAYLDLWNAHHLDHWNGKWIPMIISEFGRQGIFPQFGPWTNDFKPFIFMTTIIRMWMTFMERPDIQLTVPFILGESDLEYAPRRGMTIYTRPRAPLSPQFIELARRLGQGLIADNDGPQDNELEPTRFYDFYRFFTDVRGHRIPVNITSEDTVAQRRLFVLGFRAGDTAYLWLHNGGAYPQNPLTVDLGDLQSRWGEDIDSLEVKRLYFAGPIPDPHATGAIHGLLHIDDPGDYRPMRGTQLQLSGEETAIVRIRISDSLPMRQQQHEYQYFASGTVLPLRPGEPAALYFTLTAEELTAIEQAWVQFGLANDGGFTGKATILLNGTAVASVDLSHSSGITHYHAVERLALPAMRLQPGRNRMEVMLEQTPQTGNPMLVSGRLSLQRTQALD